MSNAITWDNEALVKEAEHKFASLKKLATVVKIALVLILTASSVNVFARLVISSTTGRSIELGAQVALFLCLTAAYVCSVFLLKLLARIHAWQSECQTEWS